MNFVTQLNSLVTTLNGLSPYWYVFVVGPLATAAQHLMKSEQSFKQGAFAKKHGLILSLVLAFGAGGFYAVFKTHTVTTAIKDTGIVGSPIWVVSQVLYKNVAAKIEAYRVSQLSATPASQAQSAPLAPTANV